MRLSRHSSLTLILNLSVLTTLLLGCTPAALEPTITPIPPTAVPSATPEPTKVPIPEGAVETADGKSIFVEQGKMYMVDATIGIKRETELSKEVFTNVFDASDLVKQLHPELFEGDQQPLLDFLLPPETVKDGAYDFAIEKTRWAFEKQVDGMELAGVPLEIITVKMPEEYPADYVFIMMMAVYGLNEPLPVTVGIRENWEDFLIMDGSCNWNLFQQRSGKPNSVAAYSSIKELSAYLSGQRITFMMVVGTPDSSDEYMDIAYGILPKSELITAVEKYYLETYGSLAFEMRNPDRLNGGQPGGTKFAPLLDTIRKNEVLRVRFPGFLPSMHQAEVYLPQLKWISAISGDFFKIGKKYDGPKNKRNRGEENASFLGCIPTNGMHPADRNGDNAPF